MTRYVEDLTDITQPTGTTISKGDINLKWEPQEAHYVNLTMKYIQLGHASLTAMRQLPELVLNIPHDTKIECDSCLKGKARTPDPPSHN